jgi:NAD(P)-dependent dehydrogenase (short-subunit alcohol dehydrogenase family)
MIHGRDPAGVQSAVSQLLGKFAERVKGLAADLAHRSEQDLLAESAGDLDVLVNCAGVYEERALSSADETHWQRTLEINLTAPWRLTRALLPGLERRKGVIVNVGSDSALLGYAGSVAYCASKGALVGQTRALAIELASRVRALCVCPGAIDTDMMRRSVAAQPDPEAALHRWRSYSSLKRFAHVDEIAEAIIFAASPNCTFQTGSVIVVDGGTTAGRLLTTSAANLP